MEIDIQLIWPLAVLALLALANLFYQYRFWWKALRYRDQQATYRQDQHGVSVIIAARNEAENLQKHLPAFLEQDYPNYEVIVVNDCSYDDSADILMAMEARYKHLKVVTIEEQPKYPTGKKFALTLGIKAATHNVLLFSDADCRPASKNWVQGMQRQYIDKTEIVLGYGAYEKQAGILNALIRFDTVLTSMQYFGHALSRRAFMGVGRNLSYLRSLFFFHKGFVAHIKHPSGDDDLFVNAASNPHNVRVCLDMEASTISIPKKSFAALSLQKSRHLSSATFYKGADKFWQAYYGVMSGLLFMTVLANVYWFRAEQMWIMISVGIFLLSWLHKMVFLVLFARRLQEKELAWWLPIVAPLHQFLQIFWAFKGVLSKPKW
jgi:biofilm PGA synthesis N-glycosyltransferase PgaC